MIPFEQAHAWQLEHAHKMLTQDSKYYIWNIPLWLGPRLYFDFDALPDADAFCTIVAFRLDRDGKLMPADERSERAIEEWEKKYAASWHQVGT